MPKTEEKPYELEGQTWFFNPHESQGTPYPIFRIVLTGGPCGGKTTATVFILERLTSLGFKTLIVPEVATRYILSGIGHGDLRKSVFQQIIITGQQNQEREYMMAAKVYAQKAPVVLLFDRGVLDGAAFCTEEDWKEAVENTGLKPREARDSNYDLVIHLVTAADGAPEAYTLSNNKARKEDREEAVIADRLVQKAWLGHPRFKVIDNSTDFREKVNRAMEEICRAVGMPASVDIGRKFLVCKKSVDSFLKANEHCEFSIRQTYLESPNGQELRLRRREQAGSVSHFYTKRIFLEGGRRVEEDSLISEQTYMELLGRRDQSRETVSKRRFCLLHNNQYIEIDRYEQPVGENDTLSIESSLQPVVPDGIKVVA